MKKYVLLAFAALLIVAAIVVAQKTVGDVFSGVLNGFQEVPSVSTVASATFEAAAAPRSPDEVRWRLTYQNLEGAVTQAHIHFGQPGVNGGISVWLCSNLASPPTPAGVQPCPAPPAAVEGSFTAADVVGPNAQGIAPGEFAELLRAMEAGFTYANVHTTKFPGGEVRSQLSSGSAEANHKH